MGRIGKHCSKEFTDCKGELFIVGKNYFSGWEQYKCSLCGKIVGDSYERFIQDREALRKRNGIR